MRSSTSLVLNKIDTADLAIDISETASLLDQDDPLAEDVDALPDSDREEQQSTVDMQRARKHYLADDIESCLRILYRMQDHIPEIQKPLSKKINIYTSIFLMFAISAIVTPSVFLKHLIESGILENDALMKSLNGEKHTLDDEYRKVRIKYDDASWGYKYYAREFTNYLGATFSAWFNSNDNGYNCRRDETLISEHSGYSNDPDMFCNLDHYYKYKEANPGHFPPHFSQQCKDLASQGCDSYNNNLRLKNRFLEARSKMDEGRKEMDVIERNMKALEQQYSDAENSKNNTLLTLVLGPLGVIFAVGLTAVVYGLARSSYKQNIAATLKLDEQLNDPVEANAIINITTRLNIAITPETTVAELIEKLEAKQEEINQSWKCRIAFLGGSLASSESSIHRFFANGALNDVKKIILNMADLTPAIKKM
jgi:hypothetical protein